MKLIPIQRGYQRIFARQAAIEELELHANGHCAHVGRLSPGCLKCFVADRFYINIPAAALGVGAGVCQASCPYCPDDRDARPPRGSAPWTDTGWEVPEPEAALLTQHALAGAADSLVPALSFSGGGEPTLRFSVVAAYMRVLKERVEPQLPSVPWYFLYTNGLEMTPERARECRELGIDEVRFHLGASGFAERVYDHLAAAVEILDTVTVETPAWPPHRDQLFEMLPRIADLGVRHLNLGQVEVGLHNRRAIERAYPAGEIYQVIAYQLDDGGLVYDLMREALDRGYPFSVLDCNGFVKAVQRGFDHGATTRQVAHDDAGLEDLVDLARWRRKQRPQQDGGPDARPDARDRPRAADE